MQLGCDVADLLMKHTIDHRMHVFVGGERIGAARNFFPDTSEAVFESPVFLESKDASPPKRYGPRLR